jgi:hypothetical protein
MIRRTPNVRMHRRLGDMELSQGCIQYEDPDTGVLITDPSTPCGSAGNLPDDTGADAALASFASSSVAQSNQAALNQIGIPFYGSTSGSTVLSAPSLTGSSGIASPIPGLGLGPNVQSWLIWALIGGGVLLLLSGSGSGGKKR